MARRPSSTPRPEVLFVMPPGGSVTGFPEHVGIAFLRAVLGRAGIGSAHLRLPSGAGLGAFARHLEAARPRIVGFTVYESNLRACRALARVARAALPDAVLLAGGPNATVSPAETLDLLGADACLRGAGAGALARLAGAILGGVRPRARLPSLLSDVPNLLLRDGDRAVATAPASLASFQREHFAHLDDLPSPYQAGLLVTPEAGLLTARGCNQHCTYCSFAALSERRVAFHSVERVLEDLAAWRARLLAGGRRPARVSILDDAFTLAPERARAICEGIVARGLQLPFECETRADRVDGALLRLMRRAGVRSVAFGLESAVPRVLRAIGKVQAPDAPGDPRFERERAWLATLRGAVRDARRAGLEVHLSVIGGLPGESAADLRATLAAVEALRPDRYAHNLLAAMPGTPLHAALPRHGIAAGRDPVSGAWITRHAYDVRSVAPASRSSLRRDRAQGWLRAVDALCGRPLRPGEAPEAASAVVIHGRSPDAALARWVGEVLAVGGLVVVLAPEACGAATWDAWAGALLAGGAAHGPLHLLSPDGRREGGAAYQAAGPSAPHRLVLSTAWPAQGRSFEVDAEGRGLARLWLAGDPAATLPAGRLRAGAVPQIADGCRWWTGWPRCEAMEVLHVRPDGAVAACWSGPPLGEVGDPLPALRARAAALVRRPGRGACPLGPPPAPASSRRELERLEVASQISGTSAVSQPGRVPGRVARRGPRPPLRRPRRGRRRT
ncbi:MAG: radical SAM protein [Anaeromyxobacteraceae bacterium]|nr:radical SAM protein [Anaeromyxobacteraceae bacterium]